MGADVLVGQVPIPGDGLLHTDRLPCPSGVPKIGLLHLLSRLGCGQPRQFDPEP